jgi:hypothetical protein
MEVTITSNMECLDERDTVLAGHYDFTAEEFSSVFRFIVSTEDLLLLHLSDPDQVSIRVNNGELLHSPWLLFQEILSRNASPGKVRAGERTVNILHVRNPDVAPRRRFRGTKLSMRKEMNLHCPAGQDGVVSPAVNRALEAELPVKGHGAPERTARQDWNRKVV